MSMNLNATCGKETIRLFQTPTQISYMICINHKGNYGRELKRHEAKRALYSYIEWVRSRLDREYDSQEKRHEAQRLNFEHIEYIKSFLDKKGLRVWVM